MLLSPIEKPGSSQTEFPHVRFIMVNLVTLFPVRFWAYFLATDGAL